MKLTYLINNEAVGRSVFYSELRSACVINANQVAFPGWEQSEQPDINTRLFGSLHRSLLTGRENTLLISDERVKFKIKRKS